VQLRDIRVCQPRQRVAFAQEALDQFRCRQFAANELQRDLMSELPIRAFGQIHAAHAANTQFAQQTICADLCAGVRRGRFLGKQRRQQFGDAIGEPIRRRARGKQRAQFGQGRCIAGTGPLDPRLALFRRLIEGLREQQLHPRPVHRAVHGKAAPSSR
jgi:hypothetical protein